MHDAPREWVRCDLGWRALWVNLGPSTRSSECPSYPRQWTSRGPPGRSQKCQNETHAVRQNAKNTVSRRRSDPAPGMPETAQSRTASAVYSSFEFIVVFSFEGTGAVLLHWRW